MQSSRLRALLIDVADLNPRMGIGKPRGKFAKNVLKESNFDSDIHSETDSSRSDCMFPFLQKMGVQMCSLSLEVAKSKLGGAKLDLVPRPAEEDD
uniref:Uncharacterized protein n=1 Tax=Oryza meridionalis TaxID=40149 RepID=A0A0E0EAE6_9ORYZ